MLPALPTQLSALRIRECPPVRQQRGRRTDFESLFRSADPVQVHMSSRKCLMCNVAPAIPGGSGFDFVECTQCISAKLDTRLRSDQHDRNEWHRIMCTVWELNDRGATDVTVSAEADSNRPIVSCVFEKNGPRHVVNRFPNSISEKAEKLLAALVRRSKHYGDTVVIKPSEDCVIAYAKNDTELHYLAAFLESAEYLKTFARTSDGHMCSVTPKGFEVVQRTGLGSPLTIFISSTCHDLKDARAELAEHLESLGHRVLMSDDPLRFDVAPDRDSIESCLFNVEKSDLVVCLIDQRYGPPLGTETYATVSATHAEINHARERGVPIFYCIRKEAFQEYSVLKRDQNATTVWVEPRNSENRINWFSFVSECVSLPREKGGRSNWADQFSTSVDLKKIVAARVRLMQQGISPRPD